MGLFGTIGKVLGGAVTLATGVNLGGSGSSSSASQWPSWDPRSYSDYSPNSNQFSEDGRRWSNAKGYWENHSVKAAYQSPGPSGAGLQKRTGGPGGVLPGGSPVAVAPAGPLQQVGSWLGIPPAPTGLPFDAGAPLGGPNAPPAWLWAAGGAVLVAVLLTQGNRARR